MTVGELGRRMDAAEFLEWAEYDRVHMPDEWIRHALLCLVVNRVAGNRDASLEDFLPERERPAEDRPRPAADPFQQFVALARRKHILAGPIPVGEPS